MSATHQGPRLRIVVIEILGFKGLLAAVGLSPRRDPRKAQQFDFQFRNETRQGGPSSGLSI